MKRRIFFTALTFILIISSTSWAFKGREKWNFQPDTPITSGIAISGNTLLFGSETGRIYALNKDTGRMIWDYKTDNTIYGNPAVIGGKAVFAQADGEIICINISDGSLVWTAGGEGGKESEGEYFNDGLSDGAVAGEGMIFVSKSDRKLHALSAGSGKTLWTYTAGDQGLREAPAYSEGLVFLGEYDGIFSIIDAKTGKRLNGGGAGGAVNTPTVSGGNVYFSAWDGSVNAVKIKDVIPLWSVNVHEPATSQPAVSSGLVVVGTGTGSVVALNEADGSIKWKFTANNGSVSATPIIAEGLVFAGAESGHVFVLDANTGREKLQLGGVNGLNSDALYSGGVLYLGGSAVYAYE